MPALFDLIRERLASPATLYLVGRAFPAAVQVVSVPVFLHLLGAEAYGQYAIVLAVAALGGTSGATWLAQSALRYRSGFVGQRTFPTYVATMKRGGVLAAVVTALVVAGLLGTRGTDSVGVALGVAAALAIFAFTLTYADRQADLDPILVMRAEIVRGLGQVVLPLGLVLAGVRSYGVLLGGFAVGNAVAAWVMRSPNAPEKGKPDYAMLGRFARFGGPLTLWMGCLLCFPVVDRYVIERFFGMADVGLYTGLYDIVYKSTTLVLAPVLLAAHPEMTRRWNTGAHIEALGLIGKTARKTLALGVLGTAAWALVAPVAAPRIAAGGEHLTGLVWLIAASAVAWGAAVVLHKTLELRERTWLMTASAGLALSAQVGVAVVLAPRIGLSALPLATLSGALAYVALTRGFAARIR